MTAVMSHYPSPTPGRDMEYRSISPPCMVDRNDFGPQKHRKAISTGGGRAWTEEEEAYLLRTRRNKMPYKHIATQLRKTELACRLHYHQMSYGSNRRKRGTSIASLTSTASYTPNSSAQDTSPGRTPYEVTPLTSPSESPRSAPSQLSDSLSSPPLYQGPQLPLLPKPVPTDGRPVLPKPLDWSHEMRVSTELKLPSASELLRSPPIDPSRLRDLYHAHRQTFWSQIANQYSPNSQVSATELEAAFFAGHGSNDTQRQPPTPELSPQFRGESSIYGSPYNIHSYNAITSPRGMFSPPDSASKCAVNSLLNGPVLPSLSD